MNDDSNVKTLSKVFVIVFIIIFIIIIISLVRYVFSVNSHSYTIPTTTTKYVDKELKELSSGEKLQYNNLLSDKNFLISLHNGFSDKLKYISVNLVESEEAKFKVVYTSLKLKDENEIVTLEKINDKSYTLFNTELGKANLDKYFVTDHYEYEINYANPTYCMKATKFKIKGNDLIVNVDLISYTKTECNASYLDYDDSIVEKKANLDVIKNNDGTYYIRSFIITE